MNIRYLSVALAVVLLAGGAWWYTRGAPSYSHTLAAGDTVASWDFQGSHDDGGELEKRANDEITRLKTLLHNEEGEPTDYSLYVGIANQYNLLGDGAHSYEYLLLALAIDAEKTGLAWHNLAALMERLGALGTARDAYARAVDAQPQIEQYTIARLEFLTKHFSDDTALLEATFEESEASFKRPISILQIKAAWLTKLGRFEEAIDAWKKVQALMPEYDPAIDKEIARLRARL